MSDRTQVKAEEIVVGRWPTVLARAGLSDRQLSGRSTECPLCGGNTRFRFVSEKTFPGGKAAAVWVCNHCTGGTYRNPFSLLIDLQGGSFQAAADFIREVLLQNGGQALPQRVRASGEEPKRDLEKERWKMQRIWNEARPIQLGDPVDLYLRRRIRGICPQELSGLRFHPALEYWDPPEVGGKRWVLRGKYPGMVAFAQNASDELVQLHKSYLTHDGDKADVPIQKKTSTGVGANNYAIRVFDQVDQVLGVSEGIEQGLAASLVHGIPVWPTLSGNSMALFSMPHSLRGQVKELWIIQDNDPLKERRMRDGSVQLYRPGEQYANQLAERARKAGVRVRRVQAKVGMDFDNYLAEQVA